MSSSTANSSGRTSPSGGRNDLSSSTGALPARSHGDDGIHPVSTSSSGTTASYNSGLPGFSSGLANKATSPVSSDSEASHKVKGKPTGMPLSATASKSVSPPRRSNTGFSSMYRTSSSSSQRQSTSNTPTGGRLGSHLPQGLHFDSLRPGEVGVAHKLEAENYEPRDDAASLETLRYRFKHASHLFLGAFLPLPPPKVSGPLSMSGPRPRKLIAFTCGTASSAMTARALKVHQEDEDAWLVCMHSIVVAPEYQREGLGLKLLEEYMRRLRRAEEGKGDHGMPKRGYECTALLTHEDKMSLFEKAGFKKLGVSHVNSGSGGWYEMRRKIIPADDEDDEISTSASPREATAPSSVFGESRDRTQPGTPSTELAGDQLAALTLSEPHEKIAAPIADSPTALSLVDDSNPSFHAGSSSPPSKQTEPRTNERELQAETGGKADGHSNSSPAPFTQTQILEALQKQSAARSSQKGPRNPGMAYSSIMGQTLASKTSVEDAFFALEARLVDRDDMTNLADLYCPREECGCLLLKAGTSDWEMAEVGPLAAPEATLPNSPSPPACTSMAPPPATLEKIRSALGTSTSVNEARTSTPARPFWIVQSPMIFENVGFSKDADWTPPIVPSSDNKHAKGEDSDGKGDVPSRKKPTKRTSLFKSPSERRREKESKELSKRETTSSLSPMSPMSDASNSSSSAQQARNLSASSASDQLAKLKVKYLLCADCDCGPLGYTVLPISMQGGNFAQEVSKQTQKDLEKLQSAGEGDKEGGEDKEEGSSNGSAHASRSPQSSSQSGSPSTPVPAAAPPTPHLQLYFVAADRVRYRFRTK